MAINYEIGLIAALLRRLRRQRLPRLLDIEEKVINGERLTNGELNYLLSVIQDTKKIIPLFKRNPEYQEPQIKLCLLYEQITRQALINEHAQEVEDSGRKKPAN